MRNFDKKIAKIILTIIIILMAYDYNFFVKTVVINIGTKWRVIDVSIILFILFLMPVVVRKYILLKHIKNNKNKLPKNIKSLFLLYIIITSIALLRGYFSSGTNAIAISREYILGILFFVGILEVIDNDYIIKLLKLLFVLIIPIWLLNLVFKTDHYIGSLNFLNASTALSLATFSIIFLSIYFIAKNKIKIIVPNLLTKFFVLFIIFNFIMILYTRHRSVWLGTIFGILMLIYTGAIIRDNKKLIKNIKLFVIVILSFYLFLNILKPLVYDASEFVFYNRFAFLTRGIEYDPSAHWRYQSWNNAINYILKHSPIMGLGFDFKRFYFVKTEEGVAPIHNDYIYYFQGTGIIGVSIFILFLWGVLSYGIKNINKRAPLLNKSMLIGSISSYAMHLVYMFFYAHIMLLWFLMALIIYYSNNSNSYE